jgi:hypothetical protein
MALDLSRVEAAVARDNTVNQSAITLLEQLSQLVRDTAGDPAKVAALADALDAQQQALADAVVAHTPSAPPA